MSRLLACVFLFVALWAGSAFSEDSTAVFRVDSIRYDIGDAFDDSKSHTQYDKWAYDILNWWHIETREMTVRKLLLFDEGDSVNLDYLLESERFLRSQIFLSDASITMSQEDGKNIATVHTSDNWTLTPTVGGGFEGKEFTYDNLNYIVGIRESNFLGFGQQLGFYYGHDRFRNKWLVEYGDPHFLIRYNRLDFLYSYNSDGYLAYWKMYRPFLSRSVNQWAYTLEGLKNKRTALFYGSGELPTSKMTRLFFPSYRYGTGNLPPAAVRISHDTTGKVKSLPELNNDEPVELIKVRDYIEDSLSFRLSRSFGGVQRKFYLGATYDYQRKTADYGRVIPNPFIYGDGYYAIDSASAADEWVPERKDSRLGMYLRYANLRYEKIKNFRNVKWTEDINKGAVLEGHVSKNYEQLGSADNDIRLDFLTNLYLGRDWNHLNLATVMNFYLDHGHRRDFYSAFAGEYIFHPNNTFSTVLKGRVDFYKDARYGYQLSLGGTEGGFVGFPVGFYAGQARVFGNLEQRYFADFEIATLMPVFVVFGDVGETAWDIKDINRKDLIYVLGFGARFVQTKSISHLVNKLDVSFPLNGAGKGEPHYSITVTKEL